MANTGQYAYELLEQYNVITGLPTGTTKLNSVGDPNYVAPRNETNGMCPIKPTPVISVRGDDKFIEGVSYVNFIIESSVALSEPLLVNVRFFSRTGESMSARLLSAETGKWESDYINLAPVRTEPYRYGYMIEPGAGYIVHPTANAFVLDVAVQLEGGGGFESGGELN